MRYGYFDDDAREYVIQRPDTPQPWINYLGCEDYFGLISNTAGGYSFYRDARLRRLTRYRYNNTPLDVGGRYIYLRDDDASDEVSDEASEKAEFWSPSWQPACRDLESYTCRHGLGYTVIGSTFKGVEAQTIYFVPLGESLEVWRLTLTNRRNQPVHLSVFSSIEFCLWDAQDDTTNFQRNFNTGQVEVPPLNPPRSNGGGKGGVIYHKTEYRERRNHFAYFACSEPLAGFDTQREAFLGAYRGWDNPAAVERGESFNSIAHGWQPIGSHHVKVTLEPGQTRHVIFVLGYHENPPGDKFDPPDSQTINKRTVEPIIARYLDKANVDAAFNALQAYWDGLLGILQVSTPDTHTNRMVNIWNAYQCMITFNISRSASFYESGIGRGMGFRDSNQDLLGFVHMVPARARQRILDLTSTQLPTGGAYHQYQPLTKRGNDAVGSGFNDDPAWLVLAVAAYLKETGDSSILDERAPYDNAPGSETPLYEHLERAIRYTLDRLGPHGLPQIGHADWNDCLNLNCFSSEPGESFQTHSDAGNTTTAESVFIGGLFVLATREMADIARHYGHGGEVEMYRSHADAMSRTVLEHGWDGEWFLRAYDRFGAKVGSRECEEGRIFIEPQGICVMAGIGLESGQAQRALDSVGEQLATPHGIVLQQPAYTRYYLNLGEISSYPPGYKENAGVFCHTNPWAMIAEAQLGRGERAFDYYTRINPSAREVISEVHRCEPYVYAQMIAGRDAPTHGEAKNSWLSGTAAWNFVAISQWILGVRADHAGLVVDPCIPSAWDGFTVTRKFRGATYVITVHNPAHVCHGIKQVTVDGQRITGNVLPILGDGKVHRVEVVLA